MIISEMSFVGGCLAGVVGTLAVLKVRSKLKQKLKGGLFCRVLSMERVTSLAYEYLNANLDVEEVAIVLYDKENMPETVASAIRANMAETVQHVLLLVAVKNNESKNVVEVLMAEQLDEALKLSLADGVLKMGR